MVLQAIWWPKRVIINDRFYYISANPNDNGNTQCEHGIIVTYAYGYWYCILRHWISVDSDGYFGCCPIPPLEYQLLDWITHQKLHLALWI